MTSEEVLRHLNNVWTHGEPSSELQRAGVLVHVLDNTEANGEPWLPCRQQDWCGQFGDRISASLINAVQPTLFSQSTAGLILSPHTPIHCSYPADGGTMPKVCGDGAPEGCVPGCSSQDGTGQPAWCSHDDAWQMSGPANIWNCAFRPEDLEAMLRHHRNERRDQYNEIVVGTESWKDSLPNIVMAIFWLRSPYLTADQLWGGEQQARGVHSAFRERYPGASVPLVSLDTTVEEGAFEMVWAS